MKRIARSAIVEHPASDLYALVDDIESYPRFLPWCTGARVEERTQQGARATLTIGMRGLHYTFTTQNTNRPGEAIEMRLVRGPFRHFRGEWRFRALSAQSCAVQFALEYELEGVAARLLAPLLDRIADTIVDAFMRRAGEVYGEASR